MGVDFHHLGRTRFFRAVARVLIALLILQNLPASAFHPRAAEAAGDTLWVDAAGGCGGATPCFSTIQSAIDAAGPGQTVRVLAGAYVEQLRISLKNQGGLATESDRITIEADPAAGVGDVVLRGAQGRCQRGPAVVFERASFVTLRGFRIEGAGKRGVALRGGSRGGTGIHLERNRIHVGSPRECLGGIDVGRGNPGTVIANNVLSGVRRQALRFRNKSGRAYVVGNTFVRNEGNAIFLARGALVSVWNNIIAFNGARRDGRGGKRFGIRFLRTPHPLGEADVDLRSNLICGNARGEIQGPKLGAADTGNLTPTGTEGPGVTASPDCAVLEKVFLDLAGPDHVLDSVDDDFSLADHSPAADAGLDPRAQGTSVGSDVFEADYLAAGVRPGGDDFDMGAVEITGPRPTRTVTPSATPSTTATPSATVSRTPTLAPTPSVTMTVPATVTVTATAGGGATQTTTPAGPALTATPTSTRTATPTRTTTATPTVTPTATATTHLLAYDEHYEVPLGQTITIPAAGVLANDVDDFGHALTSKRLSDPDKGSLDAFGADGSFTFTAPPTYGTPPLQPVVRFHNPTAQQGTVHRVVDVNGDNKPDVIVHGANRFLFAIDGATGNTLWATNDGALPPPNNDCAIHTVAQQLVVGDVDDDGVPEIVQALQCARDGSSVFDRYVFINARTGIVERISDPLSVNPVATGGFVHDAYPTIARLAPGEPPSVIVGTTAGADFGNCALYVAGAPGQGNYCRVVFVIDGVTGAVKQKMFATSAGGDGTRDGIGRQWVPPIVFDLDGDGVLEIVSAGAVFRQDGTVAWEWPTPVFRTAIANLDDTPDGEIVMLTARPGGGFMDGLYAFKANGDELWSFPLNHTNIYGYIGVADVDRDGSPDILLTAFDYGVNRDFLLVLDREGQVKWLHYFPVTPPQFSATGANNRPAVYDLDDDGVPEVIVQTEYNLWFLDGTNGQVETTFPYTTDRGGAFNLIPTIADLDGNGHAEVIFQSGFTPGHDNDGGLWVLKGLNDDWRPVQGINNQISYYGANVGVAGTIPYPQANVFANPRTNVYGTQAEWPYLSSFLGRDQTSFLYEATDGALTSPARVSIDILPTNRPPRFTSTAPTAYTVNQPFTYNAVAVDPDAGDAITYSILVRASDWGGNCSIGATSGVFFCNFLGTPGSYVAQTFTLVATDSQGAIASHIVRLEPSSGVATIPNIVGLQRAPAETAITDAGFQVGTVVSVQSPFPAGQVITQSPTAGRKATLSSAVRLTVSLGPPLDPRDVDDDGDGYTENQGDCDDTLPGRNPGAADSVGNGVDENCDGIDGVLPIASIAVTPTDDRIVTGDFLPYTATATLTDGTSADVTSIVVWTSSAPGVATIATTGVAHGVTVGSTTISAARSGVTGSTSLDVLARSIGDQTDPTAIITAPTSAADVTEPVDVIGTASDASFLKYELSYAPAGETTFTKIGGGASPVTNGVLGKLDPTLLLNDLYDLKLTVYDRANNATEVVVTVQVTRDKKIGIFTLTYEDVNVAVSGIPISVTRTYDSRDKGTGDFGVGWRLGVNTLRLRPNREQGSGWLVNKSGGSSYSLVATAPHTVSLTLPDGKVETFDLAVTPTGSVFVPFTALTASYAPRAATVGTLTVLDNTNLLVIDPQPGPVVLVDDTTLNTFDPQRFRYTFPNGLVVDVDRTAGVEAMRDTNGNTVTFGPNGIVHSAGKSVAFVRDAQGRITQITDPDGRTQTYAYDVSGDLVSHTTAAGTSTYAYDSKHGLIDIEDPAGNHVARTEYDDDGRMIATIDAAGNRVEYTHNGNGTQDVVRDRRGHLTVYDYDAAGNVTTKTDALGHVTTYTFDARGNQLTETDALGRTATRTYDAQDNVLTNTDFDGNTSTFTYNARGQVLTATDPEGRTTTNVYDAAGNVTDTTDPEGGTTHHTYGSAGHRLTTTDPLGHTTTYVVDAFGRRTSTTTPLGAVTTYGYDAAGRTTSETDAKGTTSSAFDAAGRLATTTDKRGGVATLTYDPLGSGQNIATSTDPRGKVTQYQYDVRGNLVATTHPDGATESSTYDAEANVLTRTDRDGHTTAFEYDPLGRRTKTTNPDGTTTRTSYDAIGRVLTTTDERGNVTSHAYAANQETVTDALGHVTVSDFDGRRRVVGTTDALGHHTTYAYDSANSVSVTTADGATATTTWDAARRRIAVTDTAGRTTQFAYDADGRLSTVTDAAGGVTAYTYDAVGNRLTETDANGHVTTLTYDPLGKVLTRRRPLGQQESFTYDLGGNTTSHTDFNGDVTTYGYDALGRPTSTTLPVGPPIVSTYTGSGLRSQAGGDVAVFDLRSRLLSETKSTGEVLSYGYDAAGNRTSVTTPEGTTTYGYDALNRLASVTDAAGTTTYGYDAVGNQASVTYPNGTATTYAYDAVNRLLQLANTGPGGLVSSYTYTLGTAGERTQVVEAGPATTNRTVIYTYDPVYRLTREQVDEAGTANDETFTYTYDAVGNRATFDRNGVLVTYAYDANDRLLTETSPTRTLTYAYDANGNLETRGDGTDVDAYTWDAQNRLVTADVQTSAPSGLVSYDYDADGIRRSKTAGGVTTAFLTDKSRGISQVLVETTGATTTSYTYGNQLIGQTRAGTTHYRLTDGQLSTRQLTTAAGAVSDTYTFDAFGVQLASTGATPNLYRYDGEQLDPNVGFYYLRARYYDQSTDRFLSTDPALGNAFDPVSLHRYLYANADPIQSNDPTGEISGITVVLGVIALLMGALLHTIWGDVKKILYPDSGDSALKTATLKVQIAIVNESHTGAVYKRTGADLLSIYTGLNLIFSNTGLRIADDGKGSVEDVPISTFDAKARMAAGKAPFIMVADSGFYAGGQVALYPHAKGGIITGLNSDARFAFVDNYAAYLLGKVLGLADSSDIKNFMYNPPTDVQHTDDQAKKLRAGAGRYR